VVPGMLVIVMVPIPGARCDAGSGAILMPGSAGADERKRISVTERQPGPGAVPVGGPWSRDEEREPCRHRAGAR
jgi:hypothetical protein